MKIYHRYLIGLWSTNFLLTFCIINSLLLVGNLVRYKSLGWLNLIPILPTLIPAMLIYSLPLSSLMATLFSLSKARQTLEPITFASSGVNIQQWSRPLILIGVMLSLFTLVSLEWLQPWGESYKRNYMNQIGARMIKKQLELKQTEFPIGNEKYLYVYKNSEGVFSAIIQIMESNHLKQESFLPSTELILNDEDQKIILKPTEPVQVFNYDSENIGHGSIIGVEPQEFPYPKKFKASQSYKQLALSKMLELINQGDHHDQAKIQSYFHEKLCLAFAPFLLVLAAIPIAFLGRSTDNSRCFILGLLLIFVLYYPILIIVKKMTASGLSNPAFFMQAPNFLLIVLTIWGMRRLNAQI